MYRTENIDTEIRQNWVSVRYRYLKVKLGNLLVPYRYQKYQKVGTGTKNSEPVQDWYGNGTQYQMLIDVHKIQHINYIT
ncbi:hypothetical protein HanXRQr2_Chr15g0699541 [Helianthus annuus]|uniref:Uncharacterized protein n=1 Tax=Helianthus annuus TaxID=4232 RepID=A0A251S9D8_HELAN|nr:hypothetical protein HanXRQr2_Chr15g0699541 [Helianthus annuus]KAJ0456287.1 hypothetical protein HanIR_Chr15g0760691 [Helianthus annuus]KAJ0831793.1 hypothetical protein HanPSC8_Chr15g0671241 [Helianthus annuus]